MIKQILGTALALICAGLAIVESAPALARDHMKQAANRDYAMTLDAKAPPDERGGNRYVWPTAAAPQTIRFECLDPIGPRSSPSVRLLTSPREVYKLSLKVVSRGACRKRSIPAVDLLPGSGTGGAHAAASE
jgi:hypothetical protein